MFRRISGDGKKPIRRTVSSDRRIERKKRTNLAQFIVYFVHFPGGGPKTNVNGSNVDGFSIETERREPRRITVYFEFKWRH